jgi:hypothetical protein
MRRLAVIVLAQVVSAAPLSAQFEGTVTARASNLNGTGEEMTMKMFIKGTKQATVITMPASAGPMAGLEMRMIVDAQTNTATTLMPIPPMMQQMPAAANAKGIKSVIDLSNVGRGDRGTNDDVQVKKLGTHERIAGFDCDDYEITSSNGKSMRACVTESLGRFVLPGVSGPMGRRGGASSSPAWARAFGGRPWFPLKVWNNDGKVDLEVTGVERGQVSASLFEIPDGYVDMATLFRGRGGR